jgi:hypothetical protein
MLTYAQNYFIQAYRKDTVERIEDILLNEVCRKSPYLSKVMRKVFISGFIKKSMRLLRLPPSPPAFAKASAGNA